MVLESINDLNIENNHSEMCHEKMNNIYPDLDNLKVLNESFNKQGFTDSQSIHTLPPPPTYSDSESYYKQSDSGSYKVTIKPTAPSPPPSVNYKTVSFNLKNNNQDTNSSD